LSRCPLASRRLSGERTACGLREDLPRPVELRNAILKFLADVVIDRPSSPSAKEDGEAESRPQQRIFVTSIGPEEPVRSLENNYDDNIWTNIIAAAMRVSKPTAKHAAATNSLKNVR
jgi:hypothetical protein